MFVHHAEGLQIATHRLLPPLHILSPRLCRPHSAQILWLGFGDDSTTFHQDCAFIDATGLHPKSVNQFNLQLVGRKDWVLAAPFETPKLNARCSDGSGVVECTGGGYFFSPIDPRFPNDAFSRNPLFFNVTLHVASTLPGELLFFPSGFFHQVSYKTIYGPTAALTFPVSTEDLHKCSLD